MGEAGVLGLWLFYLSLPLCLPSPSPAPRLRGQQNVKRDTPPDLS